MRPKLPATKVSGCYPIPVILRASSRGRQARVGGHRPRDATQPQDLAVSSLSAIPVPQRV